MPIKYIYAAFLVFYLYKYQKLWALKGFITQENIVSNTYFFTHMLLTGVLIPIYFIWRTLDYLFYKKVHWSVQFEKPVYFPVKIGIATMWVFIVILALFLLSLISQSALAWFVIPVLIYLEYAILFIILMVESAYLIKRFYKFKNTLQTH